jgi:hypothetical protein
MGVSMEKRRPHYLLREIKVAFADPAKLNRSFASKQVPMTSEWTTRPW